jgi:metal-responsive CopG/Arc/MetJ family transcriptional regulator
MGTSTVNISFKQDLLAQIDRVAKQESRSRSELIREAARMYIERGRRWEDIFAFGKQQAAAKDLSETDVDEEIRKVRKQKAIRTQRGK